MPDPKPCGPCTLCCKLMKITLDDGTESPMDEWCKHCDPTAGCTIYEERPAECRRFQCVWTTSPKLGERYRPNHLKVVFAHHDEEHGKVVVGHVDPGFPQARFTPGVSHLLGGVVGDGHRAFLRLGEDYQEARLRPT